MIKRLRPECIKCMMNKYVGQYSKDASAEQKLEYMQELCRLLADADISESSPVIVQRIGQLRLKLFGLKNDFSAEKLYFNQLMLHLEDKISDNIAKALDPLKLAIQYAMAGNFIDFGAMKEVDEDQLYNMLDAASDIVLNPKEYNHLKQNLSEGSKLVYLTDNCGEIVMDKLLLRQIKSLYPNLDICVMVRGEDVLNDATLEDAAQVGLDKEFRVTNNGNGIAGTSLPALSPEATAEIDSASLIISKGQGNFETLRRCEKNIHYMFLCKCDMFAKQFQVEKFTGILTHESNC